MKNWSHIREVFKNIGRRSLAAALIVFSLTVAVTVAGGVQLYNSTKESIVLQGEVNAQQSAMSFDRYLMVRKNTVLLAGNVINNMLFGGPAGQRDSALSHHGIPEHQGLHRRELHRPLWVD